MRLLAIPALFLCIIAGPGGAEELGEAFFGYRSEGPIMEMAPGHFYTVGTYTGTLDFADDNVVLDHAAQHCMGFVDFAGDAGGYCIITASNGDRLFAKWSCVPTDQVPEGAAGALDCSWTFNGGTGGFEGATGTARSIGANTVTYPDGTSSGYDTYSSFDLVLAAQ